MAATYRARAETQRQWKDREMSPGRTKICTESKARRTGRKVPVVYYLWRNGHLDHPHYIEIPLSSTVNSLYLKDVINHLNFLRGNGFTSLYSWSCKRSYHGGFVWQDLAPDDFIYPARGNEYVLKGSEILYPTPQCIRLPEIRKSAQHYSDSDSDSPVVKKTPWRSLDLSEYKVYKNDMTAETAVKYMHASTQTEENWLCSEPLVITEIDEISLPQVSPSSLETTDSPAGADESSRPDDRDRTAVGWTIGKTRASSMLLHLISCGAISMKEREEETMSHYKEKQYFGRSLVEANGGDGAAGLAGGVGGA